MNNTESRFLGAIVKLLGEVTDGPPGDQAYVLNPGDPGLVKILESVDAAAASAQAIGRSSIAAHVDHVCYGLTLLNRWASGEENPWASADWNASWQRGKVDDAQWRVLRDRLREQVQKWSVAIERRAEFDEVAAAGTLASVVHTAYHLGAIRQMLAALQKRG